ncbi:MAG: type II toxin-antitoxin system RelE/ParE family toxin [Planctomycetes bacterium]|nr:type II toxin-antitoxin system RelE/ParE family toxin [Planctomycetota bacterium]
MIASFGDPATEALYHGTADRRTRHFPRDVVRTALRKLDMLEAASALGDLRVPPGNRLEALRGDLKGLHSIRVNEQWRIVFRWGTQGPADVRLTDYH